MIREEILARMFCQAYRAVVEPICAKIPRERKRSFKAVSEREREREGSERSHLVKFSDCQMCCQAWQPQPGFPAKKAKSVDQQTELHTAGEEQQALQRCVLHWVGANCLSAQTHAPRQVPTDTQESQKEACTHSVLSWNARPLAENRSKMHPRQHPFIIMDSSLISRPERLCRKTFSLITFSTP